MLACSGPGLPLEKFQSCDFMDVEDPLLLVIHLLLNLLLRTLPVLSTPWPLCHVALCRCIRYDAVSFNQYCLTNVLPSPQDMRWHDVMSPDILLVPNRQVSTNVILIFLRSK